MNDVSNTENQNENKKIGYSEKITALLEIMNSCDVSSSSASNITPASDGKSNEITVCLEEGKAQEEVENDNRQDTKQDEGRTLGSFSESENPDNNISNDIIIEELEESIDNNPIFDPFGSIGGSNGGSIKRKRKFEPDIHFDPDLLNIQGGYELLKKNIELYQNWCAKHPKESQGFSFLFTGMPGTGKTQLGRHIAKLLQRKLLVKRMSDIMSCYVGETEKNIAEVFAEASDNKCVLMIDEADSLFYSRTSSHTSWELSTTNEVLSQLEDFDSVFIATTNLLNNFDSAAMRRFDWKVQFLPCTPTARIKLFESYFNIQISEMCANALLDSRFNLLCPGDFKAVWRKLRFQDEKTEKLILASLLTELKYKQIKPGSHL